jgi:HAD superfamily hydrolase (TIGR01484 family)
MIPFFECPTDKLKQVRIIATDIDGTITDKYGYIPEDIIASFKTLSQKGYVIILITGRAAGICEGILNYIDGITYIISENGAILHTKEGMEFLIETNPSLLVEGYENLYRSMSDRGFNVYFTRDTPFRIMDIAIDKSGTSREILDEVELIAVSSGFKTLESANHFHIYPGGYSKGKALGEIVKNKRLFGNIITIGDSLNDESLFIPLDNKITVGVKNILDYESQMIYKPTYITSGRFYSGFLEIANRLLYATS